MRLPIASALFLALGCAVLQAAPPKEALLIANGKYAHFSGLGNPLPDAERLGEVLQKIGFRVKVLRNGNREDMLEAIKEFEERLRGTGAISFFHYGGHGVQVGGKNYLLPADANIPDERRVAMRAVELDEVMGALEQSGAKANVVVIDACRDNPLPTTAARSALRGLSVVGAKPKNSIIIYAAESGSVAVDGLFTPILAAALEAKGLTIEQIMKIVRSEVYAKSNGRQTPGEYNQLFEELVLAGDKIREDNSNQVLSIKSKPLPIKSPEQIEEELTKRITRLTNDSDKDFRSGNLLMSLAKIREVEKLLPDDPGVVLRIGRLQEKKGDLSAAAETYKKALAFNLSIEQHDKIKDKISKLSISSNKTDYIITQNQSSTPISPIFTDGKLLQSRPECGNSSSDCLSALPEYLRNRIIDMASDNGRPDPHNWYVTVAPPDNSNLRYLQIQNGRMVGNDAFSFFSNMFYSHAPIDLKNASIDSRAVYDIACRQAESRGIAISHTTYLLRNKGTVPEPTWIVWCYHDNKYLGAIEVRARDGQVLASKGKMK